MLRRRLEVKMAPGDIAVWFSGDGGWKEWSLKLQYTLSISQDHCKLELNARLRDVPSCLFLAGWTASVQIPRVTHCHWTSQSAEVCHAGNYLQGGRHSPSGALWFGFLVLQTPPQGGINSFLHCKSSVNVMFMNQLSTYWTHIIDTHTPAHTS